MNISPNNIKTLLDNFATNVLSTKALNKLVNIYLKYLVNRLNANKISLKVKKTEMVTFKSKRKIFDGELKIKLSGKRLD